MEEAPGETDPTQDARIAQAARLARGSREMQGQAVRRLMDACAGRLERYFRNHRAPDAVAEDLVVEVIYAFVASPPPEAAVARAWLWRVARNKLTDWARRQAAEKRRGTDATRPVEIEVDDDTMLTLLDTQHGHLEVPGWVRGCVQRAAAQMENDEPQHATVLWMVAQGWSAEEVAVYFGASPGGVGDKEKGSARDRIYRARETARSFFEHCLE